MSYMDRPVAVQEQVDTAFNYLNVREKSVWAYNGENPTYSLLGISEALLIESIIKNNPDKNEFYSMDIGAGNFKVNEFVAKHINNAVNEGILPNNIKLHLFGLRAEKNLNTEIYQDGACTRYDLGGFKIENLISSFASKEFNLNSSFDVIFSKNTFFHLKDSVGTFEQAYSMLTIGQNTGYFLVDTMYFSLDKNNINDRYSPAISYEPQKNLASFINLYKAPFIWLPFDNSILVQKNSNDILELNYHSTETIIDGYYNSDGVYQVFELDENVELKIPDMQVNSLNCIVGDGNLFNTLAQNQVFFLPSASKYEVPHQGTDNIEYCGEITFKTIYDEE